jgi:DNA mismatch repair protein MutS2
MLNASRRDLDERSARLDAARAAAESEAESHRAAAAAAREQLTALRRRLTSESDALLARARELWQTVQREAKRADKRRADAGTLKAGIEAIEAESESLKRAAATAAGGDAAETEGSALSAAAIAIGQRVRVADLGLEAEVASLPDAEGKLTLRRGSWSIQSHVSRLSRASDAGAPAPKRANGAATWSTPEEAPSLEVDLRGREVDEALAKLDQEMDRALMHGLTELRIVHGVGRGVLRAAVERHLTGHPQVASQRLGVVGEGGRGVTVVRLR